MPDQPNPRDDEIRRLREALASAALSLISYEQSCGQGRGAEEGIDAARLLGYEGNHSYDDASEWLSAALAAKPAAGATQLHPHYTSTYCIHQRHDVCASRATELGLSNRQMRCKTCDLPCLCACHEPEAEGEGN